MVRQTPLARRDKPKALARAIGVYPVEGEPVMVSRVARLGLAGRLHSPGYPRRGDTLSLAPSQIRLKLGRVHFGAMRLLVALRGCGRPTRSVGRRYSDDAIFIIVTDRLDRDRWVATDRAWLDRNKPYVVGQDQHTRKIWITNLRAA